MNQEQNTDNYEVVFRPLEGSQSFAIDSRCDHTLYEGARGPGKTLTQLMRYRKYVGKGYGKFWRGVIFDLEFDHLGGLVAESKKWFGDKGKLKDGARFLESPSQYKWVWPTGEELLFRHVKSLGDYEGFHGHEYPFIGWNELTKHPTGDLYDKFMSVNRCSFNPEIDTPHQKFKTSREAPINAIPGKDGDDDVWRVYETPNGQPLPPVPLQVFSTTNPSGPGHNWVKRRFIDCCPRGRVHRTNVEIIDPETREPAIYVKTQIAIFGSYLENPHLPAAYIAELNSISDPNLRKAWLEGDWDVTAGGALDDLWRSDIHIIDRFPIPRNWIVDRSYDDGSTHPFSVGWWAEADGTEVRYIDRFNKMQTFAPTKGSLIQIYELYGSEEIGTNKGVKWGARQISKEIVSIEKSLIDAGWIKEKPYPGPADNRIRQVIDSETDTTEKTMRSFGISWEVSDKSPGSRVIGLQLIRDRLESSLKGEDAPGIYFMRNCQASIQTIPPIQRDTKKIDDVDTNSEDHPYDMVRYRVLKGKREATSRVGNVIKMVI